MQLDSYDRSFFLYRIRAIHSRVVSCLVPFTRICKIFLGTPLPDWSNWDVAPLLGQDFADEEDPELYLLEAVAEQLKLLGSAKDLASRYDTIGKPHARHMVSRQHWEGYLEPFTDGRRVQIPGTSVSAPSYHYAWASVLNSVLTGLSPLGGVGPAGVAWDDTRAFSKRFFASVGEWRENSGAFLWSMPRDVRSDLGVVRADTAAVAEIERAVNEVFRVAPYASSPFNDLQDELEKAYRRFGLAEWANALTVDTFSDLLHRFMAGDLRSSDVKAIAAKIPDEDGGNDPFMNEYACDGQVLVSRDYSTIRVIVDPGRTAEFIFTPQQSRVIKVMIEGWKKGHKTFKGTDLIELACEDARGKEMSTIFKTDGKTNHAWRRFVGPVEGRRGHYQLYLPLREVEEKKPAADRVSRAPEVVETRVARRNSTAGKQKHSTAKARLAALRETGSPPLRKPGM